MKAYLVNIGDYHFDTCPTTWTDSKFISESTIQNNIYSLEQFSVLFNKNHINPDNHVLRFL